MLIPHRITAYHKQSLVKSYYRALVIIAMRDAGHSYAVIAEYFLLTKQRVWQICKRGPVPAQLELPDGRL